MALVTGFLVASTLFQGIGAYRSRKAEKAQNAEEYRLAQENIALEKAETEESIRRTEQAHGDIERTQRTQVGASGFAVGSSLDQYIAMTQERHATDIDWMRTSGASRVAIAERESAARLSASESASKGRAISNIGSTIGSMGATASAHQKYGWGF